MLHAHFSGKKTKLPGNLSWLAFAGMMLWVGDVYWEGGFSTMGDASTQGQGAELGESCRKDGFQHPYQQGLS